ncbi:MAG TPA: hypothetical protein VGE74_32360 [Gemmata sp.]
MSIPVFTKSPAGKVGLIRRQCTAEYKINVVNKTIRSEVLGLKLRQRVPKDVLIHQYFGISTDEAGRGRACEEAVRGDQAHFPALAADRKGLPASGGVRYLVFASQSL